ncbi:hypothetical protein [Mucilaginibacter agri]|uniref:Outer membrane protein beta-barrel domain-containing protein n=1 Tax=Mucilaginibacter agri TaxID=2695265 RepID=A0A966DT51_9SPHI|nr:hypothetical protein [Mucilaginibacter agri]NCD70285.1 hypothetical protein [Mucilaginibacter agri]
MKQLYICILILLGVLTIDKTYGQARNSIGFGGGINIPLPNGYSTGSNYFLQGSIKLANKVELMPSIGVVNIESDKKGVYNGYYFVGSGRSVSLIYLSATAKYYFNSLFFVVGGASLNAGGDDAGSSGVGAHAGAGVNLNLDKHNALEFTGRFEALPDYDKTVPLIGIRAAYRFNFGR